ncbi:wax ester/triacylglycerol synthase domain-containing protein [Planotetraspora sp. GP83]|uniref:wax ester/triacylglycerol synthase domain-containing protein n=1 Tax=Planotetraspora sp. GP83 TaxID=3156264 RepID=UPI0035158BCB
METDPLPPGEADSAVRPVIERVTATDLAVLAMGSAGPVPMQVGAALVLGAERGFDVAAATELIADRIRSVPRLRQRLMPAPLGCGRPVWVDDAAFDVSLHVRTVTCPAPGDEQALLDAATAVVTEPLPRSRPLWSAVFVTGLADGAVGLVVVVDHVLADGLGGLAVLASLVDQSARPEAPPFPKRRPSPSELAADAFRGRLRTLSRLPLLWRDTRAAMGAAGGFNPAPAARCSLIQPSGPRRRMAVVRTDLAALRAAAHLHGGTVNDAILAAITGALHRVLEGRGESVEAFSVTVPVAARRTATTSGLGNQVGPLLVSLPGAGDPGRRLARIADVIRSRRGSVAAPPAVYPLGPSLRFASRLGLYRWYMRHQRRLHTVVSNVRGPDRPLTIAGATIRAIIPLSVSETGNVTVSFIALSYAGTLAITVVADPDHLPDLPVLTAALRAELVALITTPGETEASAHQC